MRTLLHLLATDPTRLVQLFGINSQRPDMAQSFHALAEDIAHLQLVGTPPEVILEDAPFIDNWSPAISPLGIVLFGQVTGHPICRGPVTRTSPIWVIDEDLRWVRTLNRFYRLGAPALLSEPMH